MDPNGKVALITGGASGIGFAIAKILLKNDAKGVTLVGRTEDAGLQAAQTLNDEFGEGKCVFAKADVCNKDELEGAFSKTIATFNQLDIVFSNAGICNENKWAEMYNVNLIGTVNCILLALDKYLPKYKSTAEGVIFNMSSRLGLVPRPSLPHYSATKAAMIALTLSFGDDWSHFRRTGVKVKAICPSSTFTPMDGIDDSCYNYDFQADDISEIHPLQSADNVAQCVLEILQEDKENGSIWYIEGGEKRKIVYPKLVTVEHKCCF